MTQVQIWDAVNLLVNEAGRLKGIKLEPPAKLGTQRAGDWTFEEAYGDNEVTVGEPLRGDRERTRQAAE